LSHRDPCVILLERTGPPVLVDAGLAIFWGVQS
jgi:hypothetical protein